MVYYLFNVKMKIAFIVSQFPSFSQTFVLNQITGLIDLGHDVKIFARSSQQTSKVHEDVTEYNLLGRTCYFRNFSTKNKLYQLVYRLGYTLKYLPSRPIPILRACNVFAYGRKALSLSIVNQIIPFFPYGKFDIIYCHFGPNGILGSLLKELGVLEGKLVTVFHGFDMTSYINKCGKDVYSRLFAQGDLFLPISNNWKNKLIELGCPERKICVHRMGIDVHKFKYSTRSKNKSKILIFTIARLVEKKGVEFAIEAIAKIVHEFPGIQYSIAGDGFLRDHLTNLIDTLNIKKNVVLLGWQSQQEITHLMRQADILLAPSVTAKDGDMEGIPVALMEACAQGIPVISTFHSGIPELIKDGVTGTLVDEREVDQLAEKLRWCILTPEKRLEMAHAAHAYVIENYNITLLNHNLIALFEGLTH